MRRVLYIIIGVILSACSYDETIDVLSLTVRLVYPENTVDPYAGARVELRSLAHDALFVDSTDSGGEAHFLVPPGLYEASTSSQFVDSTGTTWWRYFFNGVRSMIVVAPDSLNRADIELKSSRKRIVH